MRVTNGILYRNVDSSKHYHVKHKAYMFDVAIMETLPNWHELRIITKYGRVYRIEKRDFDKYSFLNTSYGKAQLVIQVKYLVQVKENTNVKTIALFSDDHFRIKENAKNEGMSIAQYISKRCS